MMKVLVVDDDKINAKFLAKSLAKRGFEVTEVHDGRACLDYVKSNDVDIILLDIMMPDLSGQEVLSELRSEYSAFELPIVMVTAKSDASDVVNSLRKGANDYITKPVNIDVAEARIKTQVSLKSLYHDSLDKKELETLNAMIVTYNHEINNPLTIAMGMLNRAVAKQDFSYLDKVEDALDRIADIVSKIDGVTAKGKVDQKEYTKGKKMISLK